MALTVKLRSISCLFLLLVTKHSSIVSILDLYMLYPLITHTTTRFIRYYSFISASFLSCGVIGTCASIITRANGIRYSCCMVTISTIWQTTWSVPQMTCGQLSMWFCSYINVTYFHRQMQFQHILNCFVAIPGFVATLM